MQLSATDVLCAVLQREEREGFTSGASKETCSDQPVPLLWQNQCSSVMNTVRGVFKPRCLHPPGLFFLAFFPPLTKSCKHDKYNAANYCKPDRHMGLYLTKYEVIDALQSAFDFYRSFSKNIYPSFNIESWQIECLLMNLPGLPAEEDANFIPVVTKEFKCARLVHFQHC
jgi:hypothetical protein